MSNNVYVYQGMDQSKGTKSVGGIFTALLSLLLPGLGQLLQGRLAAAIGHILVSLLLWLILLGWIINIYSAIDAYRA